MTEIEMQIIELFAQGVVMGAMGGIVVVSAMCAVVFLSYYLLRRFNVILKG